MNSKIRFNGWLLILMLGWTIILHSQNLADSLYTPYSYPIPPAQRKNYTEPADLIDVLPGIWIRKLGSPGQWAGSRIRGCPTNQVILMLDGFSLNDPWSGQIDLNLLPCEIINRINIYPSLHPFGFGSLGGVINIKSWNDPIDRPITNAVYRKGIDDFSDIDITFGQPVTKNIQILTGILLKKYGESLNQKSFDAQKVRAKVSFQPFNRLNFQYHLLHNKTTVEMVHPFSVPGDSVIVYYPKKKTTRVDHMFHLHALLWKIENDFRFHAVTLQHRFQDITSDFINEYPLNSLSFDLKQKIQTTILSATWGLQIEQSELNLPIRPSIKETLNRCFINTHFYPFKHLWMNIQFHLLDSDQIRTSPSGGLGLSYQSGPKWKVWANINKGIRKPSLGERQGVFFLPTPPVTPEQLFVIERLNLLDPSAKLKPERGISLESGVVLKIHPKFQSTICGYFRTTSDLIQPIYSTDRFSLTNSGENKFSGGEAELKIGPWFGFHTMLVLNYIQAKNNDQNLLERPNFWGYGQLTWEESFFENDLNVNVTFGSQFWSDFWSLTGTSYETAGLIYMNSSTLFDFKITLTFLDRAIISYGIDNIFGSNTSRVYGYPYPLQVTRFGIHWKLYD